MIERIKNVFKKKYTEKEVKRMANEAYLQGAIDFNDRKVGNTFGPYWDKVEKK